MTTAQELLEGLTPGGSEFTGDPEACAEYVKYTMGSKMVIIKRLVRERNEKAARIETLETAIKAVLRYISSHQVYDKDARGILERALAQDNDEPQEVPNDHFTPHKYV